MSSDSLGAVYGTLRTRIIAYPGVSAILGAGDTARLYRDRPPDFSAWPGTHGVMRITGEETRDFNQELVTATLEVMLFARPLSAVPQLRTLSDLVLQALRLFTDATDGSDPDGDGAVMVRRLRRDTIPTGGDADRQVSQIRVMAALEMYPAYLRP